MYCSADAIAKRLGKQEENAYSRIFEPTIVAIPPADSRCAMCVLNDGEIRVYGFADKTDIYETEGTYRPVYLSSKDGGLSWKEYDCSSKDIGACVYVPWVNKYVTVRSINGKTYRLISNIGAGDENPDEKEISSKNYFCIFQPLVLEDCKRLIATAQRTDYGEDGLYHYHPALIISDDGGDTWRIKELESCPRFEVSLPHKSLRWENNGAEPSVTRLKNGTLWLIIRTSQDYMYESFSFDNGDTWTKPSKSNFHMTLTTPFPLTLKDGRTLLFWNNTHPLPEQDKNSCNPPLDDGAKKGIWEDVFTNRDAAHVAITEDCGKTFIGCRETILNNKRNEVDFRTHGSMYSSNDRSVHQFQAIELPLGKILLSVGQHEEIRKLIIFDINWLYETQRTEDFKSGIKNLSVQGYIKSISGSYTWKDIPGHNQWNRIPTVYPAIDPAGTPTEAMQFVYNDDPRLVSGLSGMAWNFPTSKKGRVEIEFYKKTKGLQLCLADEWINPTDEYACDTAEFCLYADNDIPANEWVTLVVEWDCNEESALLKFNDRVVSSAKLKHCAPFGISYLHLQTLARERDFDGAFIRKLTKKEI